MWAYRNFLMFLPNKIFCLSVSETKIHLTYLLYNYLPLNNYLWETSWKTSHQQQFKTHDLFDSLVNKIVIWKRKLVYGVLRINRRTKIQTGYI